MRSMTGYGISEKHSQGYDVKVELRSLNGKYLDLNFRMPRYLFAKELEFRKWIGSRIERGSATVNIHVVRHDVGQDVVHINKPLAKAYYTKLKDLSEELGAPDHDIFRITSLMQDVIYVDDQALTDTLIAVLKEGFDEAFERFDRFRLKEGESMLAHVKECVESIRAAIPKIEAIEHERVETTKERIIKGLNTVTDDDNYDKNRFEQEMIYYIEKFDISEEKKRLKAHCDHFDDAIAKAPKGKKLSFIAQEMGREINTLGSKANHSEIQRFVIGMKEDLEKIKEQVLNIL